ncbi:MAG: hypothetical protein ACTHJ0_15075 [Flavipsychrobacter sp.]
MKRILYPCLFILLYSLPASAQINAVTDDGKEVILNTNGTWKYKTDITPAYETRVDTLAFEKGKNATFLLKGQKVKYGIWLDPKKWKFKAGDEDDLKEYKLTLKGEDAYAMIIPERITIPMNNLVEIALKNSKKAAPDAHLVRQETRKVNGVVVTLAEIRGTVEGINFVYLGYYYGSKAGTVQFVTYTSDKLYSSYEKEMQNLLNGFVILDN